VTVTVSPSDTVVASDDEVLSLVSCVGVSGPSADEAVSYGEVIPCKDELITFDDERISCDDG